MDFQGFFDGLMNAGWIQEFLKFIIAIVMVLVQVILYPINVLIESFFPEVDTMLANIPIIFEHAGTYLAWTFSAFAIPPLVITAIVIYYGYVLLAPVALWTFKLGINWYKAIKG